jgi:hypothetical protein
MQDRYLNLKKYKSSFKGSHAVQWVMRNVDVKTDRDAVALLNVMMDRGLLYHVTRSHRVENKVSPSAW